MKMFLPTPPLRRFVSFSILTLALLGVVRSTSLRAEPAASAATARVSFSGSLAPLPNVAGAKATTSSSILAFSITDLSAAQLAEPMEFGVALGMRNLAEFQARVGSGELVPYEEVEAKYAPLQTRLRPRGRLAQGRGVYLYVQRSQPPVHLRAGDARQIQKSFALTMQSVTVDGKAYAAAVTAPSVPAEVSSGVLGLIGLQPYIQRHTHHKSPTATKNGGPQPHSATTPNQPPFLIGEVKSAYNGSTLTTTVNGGTTTLDGTGQKIAIVINALALHSDLTAFWTQDRVPQSISNIEEVNVPGGTATNRQVEETLDEEWSSGVAPGAHVRVYCSDTLSDANLNKCLAQIQADVTGTSSAAIAQPQLHAMSMSYGSNLNTVSLTEYNLEASYYAKISNGNIFYGGVSIFASSGDSGSQPGETTSSPYLVSYPAADLSITAVGGTDLYYSASPVNGRYWTENGWGEYSNFTVDGATFEGYGGSGGGAAGYLSNGTTTIARPAWQVGTGVLNGTTRLVPDVASVGGPTVCDMIYSGSEYPEFGTSWSSPSWAGYSALINQARALHGQLPLGLVSRRVYTLIGSSSFYDITVGNNSYTSSTVNGTRGTANYPCTLGYDPVTGVGSPNLGVLVTTLIGPSITSFSPSVGSAGTSVVITGTNFYTTPANTLTVAFNAVAATSVTVNSATQITAVAPSGFTAGPITVTSMGDPTMSATNFTPGTSDLTASSTHTGSFTQADVGDTYTLTVTNAGTSATSGTVTLTDTLPSGLTATAMSGTDWTCNVSTLTATRSDALAAGASYSPITLTVNVASNAPASVTNNVSVSGGGESNTANDTGGDVTAITALTPTQSWRYQYFGTTANTGNAADSANPAGDGIPNLLKYALGLDPTKAETTPIVVDTTSGYLRLTAPKNTSATDVTYSVQITADPTGRSGVDDEWDDAVAEHVNDAVGTGSDARGQRAQALHPASGQPLILELEGCVLSRGS